MFYWFVLAFNVSYGVFLEIKKQGLLFVFSEKEINQALLCFIDFVVECV